MHALLSPPVVVDVTGIIDVLNRNEDMVATILGHEAAHALARHSGEKLSLGLAVTLGLQLISAVFMGNRGGPGGPGGPRGGYNPYGGRQGGYNNPYGGRPGGFPPQGGRGYPGGYPGARGPRGLRVIEGFEVRGVVGMEGSQGGGLGERRV